MVKERDVKNELRKFLAKIGAYQYWPVPRGFGAATVDVLFCYQGKFYAVETKRPGKNEATARQYCVMDEIYKAGGSTVVENSLELCSVKGMLGL